MESTELSRRTFLAVALAASVSHAHGNQDASSAENADVQRFLDKWDSAWADHDPQAIAALHAEDAVTVNRFGTIIFGRAGTETAMTILHKNGGIFSQASFPKQQIANVHRISKEVIVVQTRWQNPGVTPDGTVHPEKPEDMVVTYVLVARGSDLQIVQLDLHNVIKMANSYPANITHKQP
jgi:uncharacterized protein (TIGR02246 family)